MGFLDFAAHDIIFLSLSKSASVHEGALVASPLGEGERMKVRGWICPAVALGYVDATLPLSLSLGEGEATHARIVSSLHQKSLSYLGDLGMTFTKSR